MGFTTNWQSLLQREFSIHAIGESKLLVWPTNVVFTGYERVCPCVLGCLLQGGIKLAGYVNVGSLTCPYTERQAALGEVL